MLKFFSCTRKPSPTKIIGQLTGRRSPTMVLSVASGEVKINKIEETENKKEGSRFLLELVCV